MILGKIFSPMKNSCPLLIRVMVGVVFAYHGAQKVGLIGPEGFQASIRKAIGAAEHAGFHPPEFWGYMLAFTELIGGLLLVAGFATRYAAVSLAFVMFIAVWKVHWAAGFSAQAGGYEYSLTLLVCCVVLLLTGAGPLSLDRVFRKD